MMRSSRLWLVSTFTAALNARRAADGTPPDKAAARALDVETSTYQRWRTGRAVLHNARVTKPQERIGARLKAARGERQPIELAVALGVALSTVYRWEAGVTAVPVERQAEVAAAYGAPWHELFDPTTAVA